MATFTALSLAALPARAASVDAAPPPAPYQSVANLVSLAEFVPGMESLYVDPKTLPAGPFLAYDKTGRLVATVYMIPIEDIDAHKPFQGLKASGQKVDHVGMTFNAGHPGLEKPDYHIVLWHVSASEETSLK